jgi:glycosyltransferase involved in cell wall biosynthesis
MLTQPTDGGVFEHVARLCAGLAARGHEPLVAGPFEEQPPGLEAEVVRIGFVREIAPRADAAAAAATARVVRRVRPALVHAHSSKAGALARIARPAFVTTPLVYTPHGYAFAGHFESESERRRYRVAERALAPLASTVLCVCEAERRLAAQVGPERRTRMVHNGVPEPAPAAPHPALEALRRRGPVVGVVTLLRQGKGIETLVDALPDVLAAHPDATVVVAGDGIERHPLADRARSRGVSQSLHLIGAIDGPMSLLAGADVFVSASWAESFPYNVLEAMAAGVPIVATDVGGTREAIEHDVTGLLVPARDAGALAEAIAELISDRERATRLAREARARQQREFTAQRMIDCTLEIYEECADLRSNMKSCRAHSTG